MLNKYTRHKPNQNYARAKFNNNVNTIKRVNRPVVQRGGIKI
nr:MAG: hypothetical protein [Microvirus Sku218]